MCHFQIDVGVVLDMVNMKQISIQMSLLKILIVCRWNLYFQLRLSKANVYMALGPLILVRAVQYLMVSSGLSVFSDPPSLLSFHAQNLIPLKPANDLA
jgi:hypothetical protein